MEESFEKSAQSNSNLVKLKSFPETFNFSTESNRIFFYIHEFTAEIHYAVLQLIACIGQILLPSSQSEIYTRVHNFSSSKQYSDISKSAVVVWCKAVNVSFVSCLWRL